MDKSYSFEVLENLTPFVILVFLRVTQGKKEDIKHYFLKLFGLLFVKGHKIESQENIKEIWYWCSFLGYTHLPLFNKVNIRNITDYRSSVTHINSPKLPHKLTNML